MTAPAIIVLTGSGSALAERIRDGLGLGEVHALATRVDNADVLFDSAAPHIRTLFQAGRPVVGICAAGILIRAVGPVLADKQAEPPVIAVAEDGSVVVPLLGGHHGGNRLARRIADALESVTAITTAGDLRFSAALDEPPPGYRLANPADAKTVMAALLDGAAARIDGDVPWLADSDLPIAADGAVKLRVTERRDIGSADTLVYHPATAAIGVGCERGCDPEELIGLVDTTLAEADLAAESVAVVVSLDLKADERAVLAVADHLERPARFFDAARLEAETPRLANPSDAVFRDVGCHGVAEAAALAAAGPAARLVVPKRKSTRATCSVALAPEPIDADRTGSPRGHLAVVGIGPGNGAWRTPEATRLISGASEVVGYQGYLDLLGPRIDDKRLHAFALGEEELRARHALDLAAEGRRVALISSGDAGIYAMASLVFELLDREDGSVVPGGPSWRNIDVEVAPGISALQAAAARAGAPLGHDFCAISLSDLLTPWPAIEARIRAAAEGDFVIAFYNPVSGRRRTQLPAAKRILLNHRPAATPVLLARNLGRDGEDLRHVTLADLDPAEIDMLTLVVVGSTATRRFETGDGRKWIYSPRGYGDARLAKEGRG